MKIKLLSSLIITLLISACGQEQGSKEQSTVASTQKNAVINQATETIEDKKNARFEIYKEVELSADLSHLSNNQKEMLALLIDASKIMDELFWKQAYGDKQALLDSISDTDARRFADINYGPWDRLDGDKPFIKGVTDKTLGAQFYPKDMSKQELANAKIAEEKRFIFNYQA